MADDEAELVFDEKGPQRTCIVTRAKGDPHRMIRFVVGPEGTVVPDVRGRLPGRGAWVMGEAALVGQAVKRRLFARAFKREVVAAADLAEQVDALLTGEALAALSFANKAGQVVTGAFKVEEALGTRRVAGLLSAIDGRPDGIRKIEAAARRSGDGDQASIERLQIFASCQMDLALGRANVIHAALLLGGASAAFLEKAARLQFYRGPGTRPQQSDREPQSATMSR